MKIRSYLSIVSLLIGSIVCSSVRAEDKKPSQKKIYLNEQAITLNKKSITLNTEKGPVNLKLLRSDEKGIFVFERELPLRLNGKVVAKVFYTCDRCYKMFKSESARNYHKYNTCPLRD